MSDWQEADSTADIAAHERQRRGTRQFLMARVSFLGIGYVISVVLARTLGETRYGIYGVIVSQLAWLEMVTTAGVPGATAKLIADGRHHPDEVERSARALLIAVSLGLFAAGWLAAPYIARLMQLPDRVILFRIALLDLPFAATYASYDGLLHGHRRFGSLAIAQVAYAALKLTGVVTLLALGLSAGRVLGANVLATAVVCLGLVVRFRPRGLRPAGAVMREIALIAAPLALYLFGSQVLINLDLWSLQSLWQGDPSVVGHYVASGNIARTLTLIPAAQGGVLFASVAWATAAGDRARAQRHIREAIRFAVVIAAGAVILAMDASAVLGLLYSPLYAPGGAFLRIQLAGFAVFALVDAFSHALMAAGYQWLAAGILLAGVPVVGIGTYVLIPWMGPAGAAVGMVAGLACCALLTGAVTRLKFGPLVPFATLLRVGVAAAVVALVSAVVRIQGPWLLAKLAVLGCLYLILLWMFGEISQDDLRLGRRDGSAARI